MLAQCSFLMELLLKKNILDPQTVKLNHLNFHPPEAVSRYSDPQLQVGENYSYLFNIRQNLMFKHSFNS